MEKTLIQIVELHCTKITLPGKHLETFFLFLISDVQLWITTLYSFVELRNCSSYILYTYLTDKGRNKNILNNK